LKTYFVKLDRALLDIKLYWGTGPHFFVWDSNSS